MEKLLKITCTTCQTRQYVALKKTQYGSKYVQCAIKYCKEVYWGFGLDQILQTTVSDNLINT